MPSLWRLAGLDSATPECVSLRFLLTKYPQYRLPICHVERSEAQSKHPRERKRCEHRQCVAINSLFSTRSLSRGSFDRLRMTYWDSRSHIIQSALRNCVVCFSNAYCSKQFAHLAHEPMEPTSLAGTDTL